MVKRKTMKMQYSFTAGLVVLGIYITRIIIELFVFSYYSRIILGSNYRYLFPASALLGAAVLMICDTFARMILDPMELPVGVIMAFFGAPFFLYLLRGGLKYGFRRS